MRPEWDRTNGYPLGGHKQKGVGGHPMNDYHVPGGQCVPATT